MFSKHFFQLTIYKLLKLMDLSQVNFNKSKHDLIKASLSLYFTRLRKFIQSYPLSKQSTNYFIKRLESSNVGTQFSTNMQGAHLFTKALKLPNQDKLDFKFTPRYNNSNLNTKTPIMGSSSSLRTFLFRKQLTNSVFSFIETSTNDSSQKDLLEHKFRSKYRRKMTKLNRIRLPRLLHFITPYRNQLKSFYALSTHFYLLQRVRRRTIKHKSNKNRPYKLNYSLNQRFSLRTQSYSKNLLCTKP